MFNPWGQPVATAHPQPASVVVAGAGIIGSAAAWFLARRGLNVTVLDALAPAAEASGAADGAVSVASKRPGPLMQAALQGIALYRRLAGLDPDPATGLQGEDAPLAGLFHPRSTFIVAASPAERAVLEAHAAALAQAGVAISAIEPPAIQARFPALSAAACLVIEVRGDGHAIGYQVVRRLLAAARVPVLRGCPVTRLDRDADGGRIRAVETPQGRIAADAFVFATGNGTAPLFGLQAVLTPRKGQLLITERDLALSRAMPGSIMSGRYLLSKGSQTRALDAGGEQASASAARGFGLVVDPLRTGQFLIGGTREDHGDKRETDLAAVSRILSDAVALVPGLAGVRLLRGFAGARTAVRDGLPLVGPLPGLANGFLATGFEGDGICLGPVTGAALADLVCGTAPALDLAPFAPSRFAELQAAA